MPDALITKRALAHTMKELMKQKSLSRISVGDICESCGMSRKSFYYHFRDKYDLVNWIFHTEFLESVESGDFANSWDLLSAMFDYFYSEQEFYRCAMEIEGQNSFREYFSQVMTPIILSFSQDVFEGVKNTAFYTTFISDAILASIMRWLTEGAQIHPQEYTEQLRDILLRLARHALEELDDEQEPMKAPV